MGVICITPAFGNKLKIMLNSSDVSVKKTAMFGTNNLILSVVSATEKRILSHVSVTNTRDWDW
jgi:hypothetical protein